jgi:hypothetical protein
MAGLVAKSRRMASASSGEFGSNITGRYPAFCQPKVPGSVSIIVLGMRFEICEFPLLDLLEIEGVVNMRMLANKKRANLGGSRMGLVILFSVLVGNG